MTKEQKAEQIAALLREKEGYVRYGNEDQAAQVDEQLKLLGHRTSTPAQRSTKMTGKTGTQL